LEIIDLQVDFNGEIMNEKGVAIDHVGIATNDLENASKFWKMVGFMQEKDDEIVLDQGVKVRYFSTSSGVNKARIELLEPTGEDTPVGKFLSKYGPGIQQLCIRVNDIQSLLDELENAGVKLIDNKPRKGAHGARIAFIHPKSTGGVLVELTEY